MSAPPAAPPRFKVRFAIAVAVVSSLIALAGEGFFWWRDRAVADSLQSQAGAQAAAFERMKQSLEGWGKERAKLDFQREELSLWVEQAGARLLELEAERTRLLDRMKSLLKERNDARQETAQARAQLDPLRAQLESSRRTEAQLNAELERLKKEFKAIPPAPAPAAPRQEKPASAGQAHDFEKQAKALQASLAQQYDNTLKQQQERSLQTLEKERQKWEAKVDELSAQLIKTKAQLSETQQKLTKKLQQLQEEAAQRETDLKANLQKAQQLFAKTQTDLQRKLKEAQTQAAKGQGRERAALENFEKERLGLEQIRSNIIQDWTRLYIRVGVLETEKGNFSQAETAFRQAIQLSPSSAEAHYNLGVLYDDHMHNRVAAISEYEQYLLLSPRAEDAKMVRGWLDVLQADHASRSRRDQWNRPGTNGFTKTLKQLLD